MGGKCSLFIDHPKNMSVNIHLSAGRMMTPAEKQEAGCMTGTVIGMTHRDGTAVGVGGTFTVRRDVRGISDELRIMVERKDELRVKISTEQTKEQKASAKGDGAEASLARSNKSALEVEYKTTVTELEELKRKLEYSMDHQDTTTFRLYKIYNNNHYCNTIYVEEPNEAKIALRLTNVTNCVMVVQVVDILFKKDAATKYNHCEFESGVHCHWSPIIDCECSDSKNLSKKRIEVVD